jgi:hypothetical protein
MRQDKNRRASRNLSSCMWALCALAKEIETAGGATGGWARGLGTDMSEKIVSTESARAAQELLDKYGKLAPSAIHLLVALAEARLASTKSIKAVGDRLGNVAPNQPIRKMLELASRRGDVEAKILLESGVLEIKTP